MNKSFFISFVPVFPLFLFFFFFFSFFLFFSRFLGFVVPHMIIQCDYIQEAHLYFYLSFSSHTTHSPSPYLSTDHQDRTHNVRL